jgi:hypothetical protein
MFNWLWDEKAAELRKRANRPISILEIKGDVLSYGCNRPNKVAEQILDMPDDYSVIIGSKSDLDSLLRLRDTQPEPQPETETITYETTTLKVDSVEISNVDGAWRLIIDGKESDLSGVMSIQFDEITGRTAIPTATIRRLTRPIFTKRTQPEPTDENAASQN